MVNLVLRYTPVVSIFMLSFLLAGCSPQAKRMANLLPQDCLEQPDPGYCQGAITKYYFDLEAGECKEFAWEGCAGFVPFETRGVCLQSCLGVEPAPEPAEPDPDSSQ